MNRETEKRTEILIKDKQNKNNSFLIEAGNRDTDKRDSITFVLKKKKEKSSTPSQNSKYEILKKYIYQLIAGSTKFKFSLQSHFMHFVVNVPLLT